MNFKILNNYGGLASGHIIVITGGPDTTASTSDSEAGTVFDDVIPVWLLDLSATAGVSYFPESYDMHRHYILDSDLELSREMSRTAYDILQHGEGTYWLGYCSPSRAGEVAVKVDIAGSSVSAVNSKTFNSSPFSSGCSMNTLSDTCGDAVCGGFGCGACDERGSSCQITTGQCLSFCSQHCTIAALQEPSL